MPNNYVLLEKIVVPAAGASSVTFANIPQTGYTDLVVKFSARMSNAVNVVDDVVVSFNGSTASFSMRRLFGSGVGYASDTGGGNFNWVSQSPNTAATANTFGNAEFYIPNAFGSTNKSISADSVSENNASGAYIFMGALLRSNTDAITSIGLAGYSSNFLANSTFYLYGVAALGTTPTIAPKATGGDVIDTDGTYWYHIFRSSGTFTPAVALTTDYLVVAGGGSGGAGGVGGGGGGAGGMRCTVTGTGGSGSLESPLSLASGTGYTVTIGAGGAGVTSSIGNNGSNSVFSTITSTGGGGGSNGVATGVAGNAGGSGGGGAGRSAPANGGAASPSGQGFAGGNGTATAGTDGAGGGGGASAAGANASNPNGGAGGAGRATSITGSSVTYAGGGGGATGSGTGGGAAGSGGGGLGGSTTVPSGGAGVANTGGGSGGSRDTATSSLSGGSGIVVVRYLVA
jgi:hypothetical protein